MRQKYILLDERQLHFLIPAHLPDSQAVRIRRTCQSRRFQTALRKAIRDALGQFPILAPVRIRIG